MLKEMKNKFKFYQHKYHRSEFYKKGIGDAIIYIIYLMAYIAIMLTIVYPALVDKGTADYQITESAIEIEAGDWRYAVIKGYVDNGEEKDKFTHETNSTLISKDRIGASSDETVIVESVQTYNRSAHLRGSLIGIIIGVGIILPNFVSNRIYGIKQKIKERKEKKVAKK